MPVPIVRFTVFVIESLSHEDQRRGRSEGQLIMECAAKSGLPHELRTVTNAADFDDCLHDDMVRTVSKERTTPILHISAHGNKEGFELTDGSMYRWTDLRAELVKANNACHKGLLVSMSSCEGFFALQMALQADEAPFVALLGCKGRPTWAEAGAAYTALYVALADGARFDAAVDAMRLASGNQEFSLGLAGPARQAYKARTKYESAPAVLSGDHMKQSELTKLVARLMTELNMARPAFVLDQVTVWGEGEIWIDLSDRRSGPTVRFPRIKLGTFPDAETEEIIGDELCRLRDEASHMERCPDCDAEMKYVREISLEESEGEARSTNTGFSIPLASAVWRCASHGLFRIYVSGAIKQYREQA